MKRSTDRILTTHVGSLPRQTDVHTLLQARERGQPYDEAAFEAAVVHGVQEMVDHQVEVGLTVVNDGEVSKPSYTGYVKDRLNGFGREESGVSGRQGHEAEQFPEYFEQRHSIGYGGLQPVCNGPLSWKDFSEVERDIANLKNASADKGIADVFMTSASPGVIATGTPNRYYESDEAYLFAAAEVMRREYEAIASAGIILQLDCPELAMSRDRTYWQLSLDEFRKMLSMHVEALNFALANVPADQVRIHVCWGRPERPHTTDVALAEIVDIILQAKPNGLQITGANGRHEHEWSVWQDVKVPDGKLIMPGIIDNTTNIIEHPKLVAERLVRFANVLGRENVMGGVDCGFGNSPNGGDVDPRVAWAKLQSLAEGAEIASQTLWG